MFERLRPHRIARRLVELNADELLTRGMRGVILDLDNTLTAWHSTEVRPDVTAWVGRMRQAGLLLCVVSNAATAGRVRPVADQLGVPWVTRAAKPLPVGFQRGMRLMGTTPATTAVVGDQVFTDILGGNRLGLFTVLVDPVSTREAIITRILQRPLERLIGRVAKDAPPSPGTPQSPTIP